MVFVKLHKTIIKYIQNAFIGTKLCRKRSIFQPNLHIQGEMCPFCTIQHFSLAPVIACKYGQKRWKKRSNLHIQVHLWSKMMQKMDQKSIYRGNCDIFAHFPTPVRKGKKNMQIWMKNAYMGIKLIKKVQKTVNKSVKNAYIVQLWGFLHKKHTSPSQHANMGIKRQKNDQNRIYGGNNDQKQAKNNHFSRPKRIYSRNQAVFDKIPNPTQVAHSKINPNPKHLQKKHPTQPNPTQTKHTNLGDPRGHRNLSEGSPHHMGFSPKGDPVSGATQRR